VVPSMGDSIVEGTICAVLKSAGDTVKEDETIAQVETDKVTVDIRAPKSGVISSLMVNTDDNVEIGQTVAYLVPGDGEAASGAAEVAPPAADTADSSAPPPVGDVAPARAGGIHFPPRMTPDGRRISSLPAEQQAAFLSEASPPSDGAPAAPAAAAAEAASAAAPPTGAPLRASGRSDTHPDRYPYSEKEMECIMLGGADGLDINISVTVQVLL